MPEQIARVRLYYDSLGRVIEDSQEFGGNTRNATNTAFTSHPVTEVTYPNGRTIDNTHDLLYRRTDVSDSGSSIAAWEFFGAARVAEVELGNGLICAHMNNARTHSAVQTGVSNPAWGNQSSDRLGYDGAGRMITKRHLAGGINGTTGAYDDPTAVVGQTTAFDKASNKFYERSLQAESRSSLYEPFDANGNVEGGYDSLDRLRQYQRGTLSSTGGDNNAGGGSITTDISLPGTDEFRDYDLDGLGNWRRTSFEPVGGTEETQIRQHNGLNQITSIKDEGQPKDDLSYDLNGNLLDDGKRTYQWDAFNRLKIVKRKSDGATIGEYSYDTINRRVQKTVSNGGLSGNIPNDTIEFLYHSGKSKCCEERNSSNAVTKQYIWGIYIDELIQQKQAITINGNAAGDYYPLCDTLYRTVALTNSSGSIVEAYDTDAYGNTLIFTTAGTGSDWWADDAVVGDNPTCDFIFTGRRFDSESEIYFYRRRYYIPPLGRFPSRDPMRESLGLNPYVFIDANVVNSMDPEGTQASPAIGTLNFGKCGRLVECGNPCTPFSITGRGGVTIEAIGSFYDGATSIGQSAPAVQTLCERRTPIWINLDCSGGGKITFQGRTATIIEWLIVNVQRGAVSHSVQPDKSGLEAIKALADGYENAKKLFTGEGKVEFAFSSTFINKDGKEGKTRAQRACERHGKRVSWPHQGMTGC